MEEFEGNGYALKNSIGFLKKPNASNLLGRIISVSDSTSKCPDGIQVTS